MEPVFWQDENSARNRREMSDGITKLSIYSILQLYIRAGIIVGIDIKWTCKEKRWFEWQSLIRPVDWLLVKRGEANII